MSASAVQIFATPLDPDETRDFVINCSNLLEAGETIASFSLTLSTEAITAGLVLGTGLSAPSTAASDTQIVFWLSVTAPPAPEDFASPGTLYNIEVEIITSNASARTYQRTVAVRVAQL